MNRTVIGATVGLLTAILLVGCGNSNSKSTKSSSSSTSSNVTTSKQASSSSSTTVNSTNASSSATNSSANSSSTVTAVDNKTAGVLMGLNANSYWFKSYIGSTLYYGTLTAPQGDIPAGYSYISAHGDGSSVYFYQVNGDTITYKHIESQSATQSLADAPVVTRTVSLSSLERSYYSTPTQKEQVAGYVNQLMSE